MDAVRREKIKGKEVGYWAKSMVSVGGSVMLWIVKVAKHSLSLSRSSIPP